MKFEINKFDHTIANIEKRSQEIPFGNSKKQISFLVAESQTPERASRTLLLNFYKRFNDLKSCSINRRKDENKVKRLKQKCKTITNPLEKEMIELEIEEIVSNWGYENKLAKDCIIELEYMAELLKNLPEYTRQEFEDAEQAYFDLKSAGQPNFQLTTAIMNNEVKKCLLK